MTTKPGFAQAPHHDGSDLYVSNSAPKIGDNLTLKVRVPKGYTFDEAYIRLCGCLA